MPTRSSSWIYAERLGYFRYGVRITRAKLTKKTKEVTYLGPARLSAYATFLKRPRLLPMQTAPNIGISVLVRV